MPALVFATPRKPPKARELDGRVVVLDLAFASDAAAGSGSSGSGGFDKVTLPLIVGLGSRLAAWVDHHDHARHADYANDPRFVLATKAEHGACPEMVTPDIVARAGAIDTIVCHTDFDGLCSAAKWIRGGVEPYPGADDDARGVDTRTFAPSAIGNRFDRAIRGRGRDSALLGLIVRHLASGLADASLWGPIDAAAAGFAKAEAAALAIAKRFVVLDLKPPPGLPATCTSLAFVDATAERGSYDKTHLLLLGQERARVAALLDTDTLSLAAAFDSGVNFLGALGLSGGMPTLVSIPATRLREALRALGADEGDIARVAP
jgi:hypothetical protein